MWAVYEIILAHNSWFFNQCCLIFWSHDIGLKMKQQNIIASFVDIYLSYSCKNKLSRISATEPILTRPLALTHFD